MYQIPQTQLVSPWIDHEAGITEQARTHEKKQKATERRSSI
jgi:hypothetical protein